MTQKSQSRNYLNNNLARQTSNEEITQLANQRLQAKQEKYYQLADELRNQIQTKGYSIKDIP